MLFDSTLRKDLSRSFGATLLIIMTIVLTMFLIRTLGQAAGGQINPQDVALILAYSSLAHLPTMLTLSLFISVVATLGRMYRDSEMTIWFASGIGLSRFVSPILRMSWPVLLVIGALALVIWPWVNSKSEEIKQRYQGRSDLARVAPGQFQTSSDGRRVFFIDRDDKAAQIGRNVFILSRSERLESVITARSGHLETTSGQRVLVLEEGQRNESNLQTGEKTIARFQTYRMIIGERTADTSGKLSAKGHSSYYLLMNPTALNLGEISWRLGLLLGAGNLLFLAIGLSSTHFRRAHNWNLLLALLTFVVYYNLINLSQAWISSGALSIQRAMLLIHGGAFAVAWLFLWWRDHANILPSRPWRRRRP